MNNKNYNKVLTFGAVILLGYFWFSNHGFSGSSDNNYGSELYNNLQSGDVTSSDCNKYWEMSNQKNSKLFYDYSKKRCLSLVHEQDSPLSYTKDSIIDIATKIVIFNKEVYFDQGECLDVSSVTNVYDKIINEAKNGCQNRAPVKGSIYRQISFSDWNGNRYSYMKSNSNVNDIPPENLIQKINYNVFSFSENIK